MHVRVEYSALKKALSLAARFAPKAPGLENVHLEAVDGALRVAAGGWAEAIRLFLNADVSEEGSALTPARFAGDFVSALPAEPVTLMVNGRGVLEVTAGRTRGNLRLVDAKTPGQEPAGRKLAEFRVPADELHAALEGVLFAAEKDEIRPQLAGVYFDASDYLTLVTTDGYRLALTRLPVQVEGPSVIVPARSLKRVLPLLGRAEGEASIALFGDERPSGLALRVSVPPFREAVLSVPLVDMPYPRYSSIIERATNFTTTVLVSPQALHMLVRRAYLFTRGASDMVTVVVNANRGVVHVLAESAVYGEYSDSVEADVAGKGLTVAFNGRYLSEALDALREYPRVRIGLTEPVQPALITPEGREHPLHLLMPMKPTIPHNPES